MAITSARGLGSGIDINGLVNQLVTVERQSSLNAINRQESSVKSELSALGTLKSALSSFQTAANNLKKEGAFNKHQAASSNESIATASAGLRSVAGSHSLRVTQLATSHRLISGNPGHSGHDAVVGSGNLTLSVGGNGFAVAIGSANNTLSGIRDAINNASNNTGVLASIINVDAGFKLVLTARETGSRNTLAISSSDPGLSELASSMQQQRPALDALIEVDGQPARRSSNVITDVIQGVTIDLKSANVNTVFDLNIAVDETAITDAANEFVKSYNNLMTTLRNLGRFDPETNKASALTGDSTLRRIQSQIRSDVSRPVTTAANASDSLALIGISIDRNGVMSLDSTKFKKTLQANLNALSDVFSSGDGVAARLSSRLEQFLGSEGALHTRTESLNKQLRQFEERRDSVQVRLDNLERTLLKQFIAMDVAVGQFQSTGAFMSQQLALFNR